MEVDQIISSQDREIEGERERGRTKDEVCAYLLEKQFQLISSQLYMYKLLSLAVFFFESYLP